MPWKENDTVVLIYFSVKALIKIFTLSVKSVAAWGNSSHACPVINILFWKFRKMGICLLNQTSVTWSAFQWHSKLSSDLLSGVLYIRKHKLMCWISLYTCSALFSSNNGSSWGEFSRPAEPEHRCSCSSSHPFLRSTEVQSWGQVSPLGFVSHCWHPDSLKAVTRQYLAICRLLSWEVEPDQNEVSFSASCPWYETLPAYLGTALVW